MRSLRPAEIQAVPDLLIGRSVGSVLWRGGRWRRGQASLTEVTERLDRLEQTMRWLDASAEQLLSLIATGGELPGRSSVR